MKQANTEAKAHPRSRAKKKRETGSDGPRELPTAGILQGQDPAWGHVLLGATSEGVLVVDDKGLIVFANRQAESLFGWEQTELLGQRIEVLIPPSLKQVHTEHRAEYMQRPQQRPMAGHRILLARRKDGSDFSLEVTLTPFVGQAGTQILCLVTDSTDKVMAWNHIEHREKQFNLLIRAFPVPTYVWQCREGEFVLIDCNDAATAAMSTSRLYIGRSARTMPPGSDLLVAGIEECHLNKTQIRRELPRFRFGNTGPFRDYVVTYLPIEPDLVLTVIEDVTSERAAYNELKKLSSAVEQTADGVLITDRNGLIEYVNPGFEEMTGFTRAQALGHTPRIIKSGQMPPEYYPKLWKTILEGEAFRAQTVNRRRDGRLFTVEQTITPMKEPDGQISHFVSVLKDVTERIRLLEQDTEYRLAGMIQKRLFPAEAPQVAGYDIAGGVFPARTTSGDLFDYVSMPDDSLGIFIADATGHGMGPALIMAEARAYLHSITRHECDPHAVLCELNRHLHPDVKEDSSFITAFFARLDLQHHVLHYANAGNWPAYVLDAQGRILHELRADGIAVGIFPELDLRRNEPIRLAPGSIAVILTDGIPEAGDGANREYGVRRMLATIRRHREAASSEIVRLVRESIQSFAGAAEQADDQTIIVLKRVG